MQLAASYARWHFNSSGASDSGGGAAVTRLQGEALTSAGPPPPPEVVATGSGTILDEPNLLWCEDVWNEEREAAAVERTSAAVQGPVLAPNMVRRYEREAKMNWDLFYKRNGTNFFKDRHYLDTVFPELRAPIAAGDSAAAAAVTEVAAGSQGGCPRRNKRFLEVGCGVGNAFLPLLASNPGLDGVAIDFSPVAIDHLRGTEAYKALRSGDEARPGDRGTEDNGSAENGECRRRRRRRHRCVAHVCDVTADELPRFGWDYDDVARVNTGRGGSGDLGSTVGTAATDDGGGGDDDDDDDDDSGGYDVILLLFCLSAVAPHKMPAVVAKLARALRPGGALLFRDYGRYDHAQLRFGRGRRLGEHFYVKQDGTRVYYFTRSDVEALFCGPWASPAAAAAAVDGGAAAASAPASRAAGAAPALGGTAAASSPLPSSPSSLPPHFRTSRNAAAAGSAAAAGEAQGNLVEEEEEGPQLKCEELEYIRRQYANRAEQVARFRVWVHGKFTKPPLLLLSS